MSAGDRAEWLATVKPRCAMELAAETYGATNAYGTISLARAMSEAGVAWAGAAHGARADSRAALDLVKAIAAYHVDLQAQCEALASPEPAMRDRAEQRVASIAGIGDAAAHPGGFFPWK